jgi:predicted ATPase
VKTGNIDFFNGLLGLTPDALAVYCIDPQKDGTIFNHIRIEEDGRFRDRWPHGFFAERDDEL